MTTTESRRERTAAEHRRIAAAAAGASIKLREFNKQPVPQWLRDAAAGKPTVPPPEYS